jgi:hypothetical protein
MTISILKTILSFSLAKSTAGMASLYNGNSGQQLAAIWKSLPSIEVAVRELGSEHLAQKLMLLADFGASHGHCSKIAMDEIQRSLRDVAGYKGRFLAVHNDLPTNDWTQFFEFISSAPGCCSVGCGRTFYEQCLPDESVTVGYSSTSLHWLSRTPCEVPTHCYAGLCGDPDVVLRFEMQVREDYARFLEHRHRELVPGGVLILVLLVSAGPEKLNYGGHVSQLYECAQLELSQDELAHFTLPVYFLTADQYTSSEVLQGRFDLISSTDVLVEFPLFEQWKKNAIALEEFAYKDALFVRGWSEPTLRQALLRAGRAEEDVPRILDAFYSRYAQLTTSRSSGLDSHGHHVQIVLRKKSS